jgi:hypothetical protein
MVDVPVPAPVTETVAPVPVKDTLLFPALQVPPVVASLSVITEPKHTDEAPLMAPMAPLTVTVVVALQPPTP